MSAWDKININKVTNPATYEYHWSIAQFLIKKFINPEKMNMTSIDVGFIELLSNSSVNI